MIILTSYILCHRLIQSTSDCRGTVHYIVSYLTKSELTTHSLLTLVRGAFKDIADRREANPNAYDPPEDAVRRPILRTMMQLIGNQEIAAPLACLILTQQRTGHASHELLRIPFGAARRYLLDAYEVKYSKRMAEEAGSRRNEDGSGSETSSSETSSEADELSINDDDSDIDEPGLDVTLTFPTVGEDGPTRKVQISGSSLVLDYQHRPLHEDWNSMCFLDYCQLQHKVKLTAGDAEALAAERSRIGKRHRTSPSPKRRLYFTEGHPQYDTHYVTKSRKSFQALPIPSLIGGFVPKRDPADPLYCASVLTLFYPWRSIDGIIGEAEDWIAAYARVITMVPTFLTERHTRYLYTTELTHTSSVCRNADIINRNAREAAERHAQGLPNNDDADGSDMLEDIRQILDLTANYNPTTLTMKERDAEDYTNDALVLFNSLQPPDANIELQAGLDATGITCNADPSLPGFIQSCDTALQQLRFAPAAGDVPVKVRKSRRNAVPTAAPTVPMPTSMYQFTVDHKLNNEQAACFLSFVDHARSMLTGVSDRNMGVVPVGAPPPAFWILTGEGGSGKTHTIQAIVDFMRGCGWGRHLRVSATTGAAATNLQRQASTIDSLLSLKRNQSKLPPKATTVFNASYQDVYYIIIDEYSMLSLAKLYDICERLKLGQASDHPAGRISILFAGDPHQFQPVRAKGLSKFSEVLGNLPPGTSPTPLSAPRQQEINITLAAMVWQKITNVVVLTKNYRQHACPVLHRILNNMRNNALTDADIAALKQRIIRTDPDTTSQFIVQRNKVREALCDRLETTNAQALGKRTVTVTAIDTYKFTGENSAVSAQLQNWIDLHAKSSDCEQLQKRTTYYIGQRVRFTRNQAPELGIANGALATIVNIVLATDQDDGALPVAIYVKIDNLNVQILPPLQPGIMPIGPISATGSLIITRGGKKVTCNYRRRAFPLVPTSCITDYKSQGSGFANVVLDLHYPPDGRSDYALAAYVMLSRAKTLDGIRILRDFDGERLKSKFPEFIKTEWTRLCSLSESFTTEYMRHHSIHLDDIRSI